jgi:subtilisin
VLSKDPNIAAVEPDGKVYALDFPYFEMSPEGGMGEGMALAPQAPAAEGPSAQADYVPWGISRVKAPMCWEATKGKGIYVAVLDTGIWPHNDLKGNLLGGISFVPGESWVDGHGHGTHVAGTIAARMNGFGVVGVAPSAYLYGIKVLSNGGSGNWSWLMSGLYWMRKYYGCTFDVANMSLGGSSAPKSLEAYINYAAQQTLLVAAAGNYRARDPRPPCKEMPVMYPAKYPKCLAVSAIDSHNMIAGFSACGPEIELCAPGVNIVSTVPGNSYATMSGTSMAAPHVAGAAALCRGTHRYLDMDHIRKILHKTADDLGVAGRDELYGYGRVDCNQATFARTCG